MRGALAIAVGVGAAVLAVGGVAWTVFGPGPTAGRGALVDVVLPSGSGLSGVARGLEQADVIRSRSTFLAIAVVTGAAHSLKAGEYAFAPGASLADVIAKIHRGEVVRRFITIPEGLTSRAAVDILLRADYLTGAARPPPEGSLLPETYEVRRGESRRAVIARMSAARDRLLGQLWANRSPGLPYRSPEDAVILASVVEKETAKPDERPRIAAVFINRLRKGMRLESDPTVIYAVSGGASLGRGLRVSELASRSPYNTYVFGGLPPTPIANPGQAALAAALEPAHTSDLYFVADGTGGHVFAKTFEAHKRNVVRWRALENDRGGGPSA